MKKLLCWQNWQSMTAIEHATLITGTIGICLLIISLIISQIWLSYIAGFIMRLAGCLFMAANEKMRAVYFIPVGISLVNTFHSLESLLFIELLASAIIYQINTILFFMKKFK